MIDPHRARDEGSDSGPADAGVSLLDSVEASGHVTCDTSGAVEQCDHARHMIRGSDATGPRPVQIGRRAA